MLNKSLLVAGAAAIYFSVASAFFPGMAYGATTAELQAQLEALLAKVTALQAQLAAQTITQGGSVVPAILVSSGDLALGSQGPAVKALQQYLNANGAQISASGAGSPGNETEYFGSLTKSALVKWQAANGVSPASGYFGPLTRAKLSNLSAVPPPVPAPAPVPEAVVVPATIPAASLPNPFVSTLQIEQTYLPVQLSNYGEKILAAFKFSADEKIAITKFRLKNNGTFYNDYITKLQLLINADSGPVIAEADGLQAGAVEFKLTPDAAKENQGLITSGNSYYVRSYLVPHTYGSEKPYVRLDIESASDISAFDYNDLTRVADISKTNSFPIVGPKILSF